MSRRSALATTRLVKVPGEHRWKAVPAYVERACTPDEIAGLFHEIEHDLARSADPATELAARYRASADAALKLATVVLRASGYETHPPLDPALTFEALPTLFGPEGRALAKTLLAHHRRSRRKITPARVPTVKRDSADLTREAARFRESILDWLATTRRNLVPPARSGRGGVEGQERTQL
jgi:hypothetical protein